VSLHFPILEREKVIFIHTVIIPNFGGIIKMFGTIAFFPKNFREKKRHTKLKIGIEINTLTLTHRKSERDILNLLKELLTDKLVPSQIRNQLLISPMRTLKKNINLLIPASQQAVTVPRRLPTLMRAKMIMSNISRAILRIRIKEGS
jgi:hypothetical protein